MGISAINRRQFLVRLGNASAMFTVLGATVDTSPRGRSQMKTVEAAKIQRWSETHLLPNADSAVKPAFGTRAELTPLEAHFRMEIGRVPPAVKEQDWSLPITGLVERPMSFTLEELRKFDPTHQFVTLACISNPIGGSLIGTTRWTGVSVQRVLQEIRPLPRAAHLKITSADDFYEVVSLDAIRRDPRIMLTYAWDGLPLSSAHGFPLRIYVPDLYGMKLPKWIQSIKVIDRPEQGYWVKRGWDAQARVAATSVIDTRQSDVVIAEKSGQTTVALGGIAYTGARGVSKVQIRVDKEPWRDAQLRMALSETTWVVWRYDWPFRAGRHTLAVRCFEGNDTPQLEVEAPPLPGGATGLHSIELKQ